jgi:hypothetical protein
VEIMPDKRKLVGLVEQAYEGKLCLPNFQRDFVWPRDLVADLIRSVLRRYYIGSLLLLRCDPEHPPFAPAFLRGAKPDRLESRPELLVLDGQQRLTSLLYALTAPELSLKNSVQRRWFFVNLALLLTDPDNDEIVFDLAKNELDGLDDIKVQYRQRVLPCTTLMTSKAFMKWKDGLDDWLKDNEPENHVRYREEWRDHWTNAVNDFQNFTVPLVELPSVKDSDPESIGRVCAIFEKLNSTGVDLSVYDLLTARLYRSGIRLHDLWNRACGDHARLASWSNRKAETNKLGVLVLRTLALMRGLDPKPSILINLKPEEFERDWERAAAAIERAMELTEHVGPDGFGLIDPKWLPGFGLIPILAALRAEIDEKGLGEGPRSDLRRWYWSNVFLERYSSAVESKSRKDYVEMLAYWKGDRDEPSVFAEARARIGSEGYKVRESASYASAVYSGIFCLLAMRNARDWRFGESIRLQELQDHHIFPKAYLNRHGVTKRTDVNSVINRTLISNKTNAKIRDKAPADYLVSAEVFPSGATTSLLGPHFLDEGATAALNASTRNMSNAEVLENYEAFRCSREAAVIAEIRDVCGIDTSTRKVQP